MKRLAVLLLVTACGGGGSGASDGVSKADYLKQAEAICAKANTDQAALKTPTAIDGLAPYVSRIVAIADSTTAQMAALEVPEDDKADLKAKVLDPLREQLRLGHEYADKVAVAAKAKDEDALIQLISHAPTQAKADLTWMKDYGFKECVEAADTSS